MIDPQPHTTPPPPVIGSAPVADSVQIYLLIPRGWRLSAEGERQLQRICLAVGQGEGWRSTVQGGWFWCSPQDAELLRRTLKDLAEEFLEPVAIDHRGRSRTQRAPS